MVAKSDRALEVELTKGALTNGYISVPKSQKLFPSQFIAADDEPSERFSLVLPSGDVFRTWVLGKYGRIHLRFGALFKTMKLQPGDRAVLDIDRADPTRFALTFEQLSNSNLPSQGALSMVSEAMRPELNRIFFGPPGTGKTFETIEAALEILAPDVLSANKDKRDVLKSHFDAFCVSGDIRFVTFHQSFSYEDFVEGLRAEHDENGQLRYVVADGVFKSLCDAASARVTQQDTASIDLAGRRVWKMSLGNYLGDDSYIFEECIENDYALLGYGGTTDFNKCNTRDDVFNAFIARGESVTRDSYPVSAVSTFLLKIKVGDLIVVSEGNSKFRAIGEVTSGYRQIEREEQNDSYGQCRSVKWLRVYKPALALDQLMNNQFSQMTLYELRPSAVNMDKLAALLNAYTAAAGGAFQVGEQFGTGYEVVHTSADLLELAKPNGNRLPIGMSLISSLAGHVRNGDLSLDDIREKRVFEKLKNSKLEPFLVNGYNNILPRLVERFLNPSSNAPALRGAKVLIIDEINRGNVSRVFGELITLIEESKRAGAVEALEVILPYSKRRFSVPSNVYLIATMNTADRSLTGLDLALRRRFAFKEMTPKPELLEEIEISGINVGELLEAMNDRIEVLLDRDHRLGHAYFMELRETPTLERLGGIFRQKVLPLLQEYFFEDWSRIQLVLNDHRKPLQNRFVFQPDTDVERLFGESANVKNPNGRWQVNDAAFGRAEAYLGVIDHEAPSGSISLEATEAQRGNLTIKRLANGSIEVWEEGARLNEAKSTLRVLAKELGLTTNHPSGRELNTRNLGSAVITALGQSKP